MSGQLSTVDLVVVAAYIAGTTLLGAWFSLGQRDVRTYFVGDRNVSWWLVLISIVATETSTVTFLSVPGVAYNPDGGNLTFLQIALGYMVGRVVIAWFLLPQYFRGECFTAYELLRKRFNPAVQRCASTLFLATRTVADGLRLFLTALLLREFTGWDMSVSIVVMGAVTLLYTYLGGMEAVIWTDLIQFIIYTLGAVVAGAILLNQLPGGVDTFVAAGEAAGKFKLFDFTPDPTRAYGFWAGLIGGAFFSMATHGADQIMVQRYLCARSVGQARAALILSGVVVFLQFLLFLFIGIGLYALVQTGGLHLDPGTKNDQVFGRFIVSALPQGVVGLVVAAVLAAAMSTLSSSLNSSASASVTDFYRPLRPGRSDRHYLAVSRGFTTLWGLAQIGVALAVVALDSPRSIIDQVLSVAGFTTGVVLGLFLLGSLPRPVAPASALAGMGAGFVAVLSLWVPTLFGTTVLAWPWFAPVGALSTAGVALLVDFIGTGNGPPADRGAQPGLDQPR